MLHGPNAAGELQTFSFENSVDLGRVLSKSRTLTLGDFGATLGGHSGQRSARLLCATNGLTQRSKRQRLFDHLVRDGEQP